MESGARGTENGDEKGVGGDRWTAGVEVEESAIGRDGGRKRAGEKKRGGGKSRCFGGGGEIGFGAWTDFVR